MMIRTWLMLIAVMVTPVVLLAGAGTLWLWEHDLLLLWLGLSCILALVAWLLRRQLAKDQLPPLALDVDPSGTWPAAGVRAWKKIEVLAEETQQRDPELDEGIFYRDTLKDVMQLVAAEFYPKQKDAFLELRIPELLRVIELLAGDLRAVFMEHVPGSHILTINDIARGRRLAHRGNDLYRLYRIVSVGIDPVSAALREIRGRAIERLMATSSRKVKGWLVDAYIKKLGFYAIELYSGRLGVDEAHLARHTTEASRRDLQKLQQLTTAVQQEPLRVLVLGQVKAGKSSLINALFGELKAAVDVLPTTKSVHPYVLVRDGLERALVLDTAGYEDSTNPLQPLSEAKQEVLHSDLILLVCTATSAARNADRRLLDELRALFKANTGELPPLVVVLSHIDWLRPAREWTPPYNVAAPTSPKEQAIRHAMETVAADLDVPLEQVVPAKLKAGQVYNVEEGVVPAILQSLDQAKRLRYLRCLSDYKGESDWPKLWQQSKRTGSFIARKGLRWLGNAAGKLDELTRR